MNASVVRAVGLGAVSLAIFSIAVGSALVAITPEAPADFRPPRVLAFYLVMFGFAVPGALILSRHPGHAIGWLFAGGSMLASLENLVASYAAAAVSGGRLPAGTAAAWVFSWLAVLHMAPLATLVPLLFPDGRLPSRRWAPVAAAAVLGTVGLAVASALLPVPVPVLHVPNPLAQHEAAAAVFTLLSASVLLLLVTLIAAVAALVVRFRRAGSAERQQLKWFATAGAVLVVVGLATVLLEIPVASAVVVLSLGLALLPAATAIAILRYRLYDIDVLINRALVYGPLSALLVVAYLGSVIALQWLLAPFTAGSQLAVAGSTLAVIALVQPLRRRIQDAVDRRFYRSRYDAQRTLERFASRLRDELDLEALSLELIGVVRETVQPAHAGLWLRVGPATAPVQLRRGAK
jgi:hypothetical protein